MCGSMLYDLGIWAYVTGKHCVCSSPVESALLMIAKSQGGWGSAGVIAGLTAVVVEFHTVNAGGRWRTIIQVRAYEGARIF